MKGLAVKKSAKRERPPKKRASVAVDDAAAESTVWPRKETSPEVRLRTKLEATIADLRGYYKLGVELVGESRGRLAWGNEVALKRAEMDGKTRDYADKACQLARMYETAESFETLLAHLQAMSNKHSFALSRSHVMATLLLTRKRDRRTFLTQAAKKSWSAVRLRAEIKSARPVKSEGGRKRRLPETRGQVLIEASKVCRHLIDLRDVLAEHKVKLPDDTCERLMAFQKKCDRQLEQLRNSENE